MVNWLRSNVKDHQVEAWEDKSKSSLSAAISCYTCMFALPNVKFGCFSGCLLLNEYIYFSFVYGLIWPPSWFPCKFWSSSCQIPDTKEYTVHTHTWMLKCMDVLDICLDILFGPRNFCRFWVSNWKFSLDLSTKEQFHITRHWNWDIIQLKNIVRILKYHISKEYQIWIEHYKYLMNTTSDMMMSNDWIVSLMSKISIFICIALVNILLIFECKSLDKRKYTNWGNTVWMFIILLTLKFSY